MMPLVGLQYLLRKSATRETSASPEGWTEENPLFGHCAVVAATVQDFYGGKIVSRFFPSEWAERFKNRSHYWNVLPNGTAVDFSRNQFPAEFPLDEMLAGKIGESRGDDDKRTYILSAKSSDPNVKSAEERYAILRARVQNLLRANPIFLDEKFQKCWEFAFSEESKCKRLRFAAFVYDADGIIVASDVNRSMAKQFGRNRFCSCDGSRCIRDELNLGHRMDQTIGDCGHAIPWCLAQIFEKQYPPSFLRNFDIFEQGFFPNGDPWFREKPNYTCLSCQNIFAVFGLDKVWSVHGGRWVALYTRDSFFSSADYALGKEKA